MTKSHFIPEYSIIISDGAIPELKAYNNLKFEIHEDDENYNPRDGNVAWDYVEIDRGTKDGTFIVTFGEMGRKVSYITRPVFEGEDYDEALKIFESKNAEYQQLLTSRLDEERAERKRQIEESNRIKRQKLLIDLIQSGDSNLEGYDNEEVELAMQVIRRRINEIARRAAEIAKKEQIARNRRAEVIAFRTFRINQFGVWNTDIPVVNRGIRLLARFFDQEGNELNLGQITVVYRDFNGVMRFYNNRITVLSDSDNMIWSVMDSKFVYLTYVRI